MLRNISHKLMRHRAIRRRVEWHLRHFRYDMHETVNGVRFTLPSLYGVSNYFSEPWMMTLLSRLVAAESGIFVDVGANVGQTLLKLRALSPDRQYVGFEPNPVCVQYLNEFVRANSLRSCQIFPVGLATCNAVLELDFYSDDRSDSSASIIKGFRPEGEVRSSALIPVFRYEHLRPYITPGKVSVLKIDVEGAELEVLQSTHRLLDEDRPYVLIEILPAYSVDNRERVDRQTAIEKLAELARYSVFRILKDDSNEFSQAVAIEEIGIHSDLQLCDYVLVPHEKRDGFQAMLQMQ